MLRGQVELAGELTTDLVCKKVDVGESNSGQLVVKELKVDVNNKSFV